MFKYFHSFFCLFFNVKSLFFAFFLLVVRFGRFCRLSRKWGDRKCTENFLLYLKTPNLVSAVIHRQGQKPRAYAPFCSHLYSDSIQGSIRASQTTGRTGEVDNLGQDLLLESSTDHRPRTRTRRLPTFNLTAPPAASDGIRR